jgi:hypothetical protein
LVSRVAVADLAQEGVDKQAAAHADASMNAPDGEFGALLVHVGCP